MHKHNLYDLIEYDDRKFLPKSLLNRPGQRMVLLNLRDGQAVPEHSTKESVIVYAICGHITFYQGSESIELSAGEVLWIEGGLPHRLEAHQDSSLLVIASGGFTSASEEMLDLRAVPRPLRHPMVFQKFDALSVGESFVLINDHDPIPLNRQMETMRPRQVQWEYIVRGPEIFRIRVRRLLPLAGSEVSLADQASTVVAIERG